MHQLRRLCAVTCLFFALTVSALPGVMSTGNTPPAPPKLSTQGDPVKPTDDGTTSQEIPPVEQWIEVQSAIMQMVLTVF